MSPNCTGYWRLVTHRRISNASEIVYTSVVRILPSEMWRVHQTFGGKCIFHLQVWRILQSSS
jgi:hypothetical protein